MSGTWYNTPYVAKQGRDWFEKWLRSDMPNYEELGVDVDSFMEKMFNGYSRVLFIDDGLCDKEGSMKLSRQFAAELKLRHECRVGTLSLLVDGLARTKELAHISSRMS